MRHIIKTQQFTREWIIDFFQTVKKIDTTLSETHPRNKQNYLGWHSGRTALLLFYESSTRTITSFTQAGRLLGMFVTTAIDPKNFSSTSKGETLEDTIRTQCGYHFDIIVLRHHEKDAAKRAAKVIDTWGYKTHLINAGDGPGQHPTQALLDLYTIWKERDGNIDGVNIVFGGDLKYGRTVRSLAYLLGKFDNVHMTFVAPKSVQAKADILRHLEKHQVRYRQTDDPLQALQGADFIYWTRLQRERMPKKLYETLESSGTYHITQDMLQYVDSHTKIMHPLPRVHEISTEIDPDPRSIYFQQSSNGLPVRMALMDLLLRNE